ncbi:MAG: (2Fe-2S) ferredoxin domain-containing protein [Enterocloster sp.]
MWTGRNPTSARCWCAAAQDVSHLTAGKCGMRLVKAVENFRLSDEVQVMVTGCMGTCAMGPVILVEPEGIFYTKMTPDKVETGGGKASSQG